MCGIAGIWDRSGKAIDQKSIRAMQDSLLHRGPDSKGLYSDRNVAFAHTRLSIIDLSDAAAQPFVSPDGRYVLVFNGEIYNYRELKKEHFPAQQFVSESDTEVLLHMLIRFRELALPMLRGMFALALFDTQEQSLLIATDPFGKKPLFYASSGDIFLFASEPKAILASGDISPSADLDALAQYALHEYCPSPSSGFQDIKTIGAGNYMNISSFGMDEKKWWNTQTVPKLEMSFTQAMRRFDDLLAQAVARRMVADVPVGLFLSGGLDSSTIAWYMRKLRPQEPIYSCSIGFESKSFNEDDVASRVASHFSFSHESIKFTPETFLQSLREIVPLMDIPFADVSLLPTHAVSKLARKHMKVVLDGDGSDELLGGYGTFAAYELAEELRFIPKEVFRAMLFAAHALLPVSHDYFSLEFKIKSFLRGVSYPPERNLQVWLGAFTDREIIKLMTPRARQVLADVLRAVDTAVPPDIADSFDRASLYHLFTYLHRDILVKIDRATMAVGLEARTPFLDADVAEFLLRLPASYKRNKRILRELMKDRLPEEVIRRKKQGFGVPTSAWFADDLLPFVKRTLSQDRIEEVGVFEYSTVRRLVKEHEKKVFDHRKKIWTLISFQLWYEYWILQKRDIV